MFFTSDSPTGTFPTKVTSLPNKFMQNNPDNINGIIDSNWFIKCYSIALINSFGLFSGTTISNDGSFLIVLNVFQSIKFVDDWMFRSACSRLFTVAVN